jgi:hypothetical protein
MNVEYGIKQTVSIMKHNYLNHFCDIRIKFAVLLVT